MALQLPDSNLYQNGRVIEFDNGEQLLIRDKLPEKRDALDSFETPKSDDNLLGLAYSRYFGDVENANFYWWLIADRNGVFNPLQPDIVVDGDVLPIAGNEIVIPNILKQQPEF